MKRLDTAIKKFAVKFVLPICDKPWKVTGNFSE